MQKNRNQQSRGVFSSFIGEPTPAKQAGLVYSVSACVFFAVSLLIVLFSAGAAQAENPPQWFLYLSFLAAPIGFAIVVAWYLWQAKLSLKKFCGMQVCSPKYYLIALLMQVGLFSLGELNGIFLKFLERFGYQDSGINLPNMDGLGIIGVFIVIAVIPALMEELFFRGILQLNLREFSTTAQVLLCGALFALYHQNPAQTIYQFMCGAAFALVAVRAGSFFPTVLSHFLNNGVIVLLYKFGVESYGQPMYAIILVVSGLCLVGTVLYLTFFDGKKEEKKQTQKGAWGGFLTCACVGILVFAASWLSTLLMGL